ncbi:hypothetical protein NDU88_000786 [Pleurodeles waltl]|uniref:Uncharacterized protein n=1 Tax=Pleurodeles waltl TaxID=8319 RepID=A0AAV7V615_PLEWA|nr:hypothetical protein NDU88_000786 [Pleurodeles waltl]
MQPNKRLLPFHPDWALRPHSRFHTRLPFPSYLLRFSPRWGAPLFAPLSLVGFIPGDHSLQRILVLSGRKNAAPVQCWAAADILFSFGRELRSPDLPLLPLDSLCEGSRSSSEP